MHLKSNLLKITRVTSKRNNPISIGQQTIKFPIPHCVGICFYCRPTMDLKIRVFLSLLVLAIVVRDGKGKELTSNPLTGLSRFV